MLNIDVKKSPGPDGIPNLFLKRYAEWVAKYLTIIFQSSINNGFVPKAWKIAKIVPIHKGGSVSSVENYRPISLISTCSKLLEHIVSKHILTFLNDHDILFQYQHGFRKGLSTTTQLIETVHDISQSINNRGQTDIIFLDFAKAFDKVSHPKLLFKIEALFKNPQITNWFCSYLSSRMQFVELGGCVSRPAPVASGVPQGSVLGPLLFLIFIDDIRCGISVPIKLFADDCILYNKIETKQDQLKLHNELLKIKHWCDEWQMELNPRKSVFMSITRKKHFLNYNYSIDNTDLLRVNEYKYLGVTFTNDLRWNTHVEKVSRKANQSLWYLRRNLASASPEIKTLAYKTLVRPVLEYAKIVWDPYTLTNSSKLDKIQRLASRFIFNKYNHSHSPTELCRLAELPPLELRTKCDRLKFIFLIIHALVKVDKNKYMDVRVGECTRHRHSMHIREPSVKNDCFKFSFFPRAIKEWNQLPNSVVTMTNVCEFVKNIKSIVLDNVP